MDERVGPADALYALTEIGRVRAQVIRRVLVPDWFWWAIGVLLIVLTAAVESRHGVVLGIGIAAFVAGLVIVTWRVVSRVILGARPRHDLVDASGIIVPMLVGIMAFVLPVVGASLAVGLGLKAAKVSHPATITVAVVAVLLVIGGPMLTRYLGRVILTSRRPPAAT